MIYVLELLCGGTTKQFLKIGPYKKLFCKSYFKIVNTVCVLQFLKNLSFKAGSSKFCENRKPTYHISVDDGLSRLSDVMLVLMLCWF